MDHTLGHSCGIFGSDVALSFSLWIMNTTIFCKKFLFPSSPPSLPVYSFFLSLTQFQYSLSPSSECTESEDKFQVYSPPTSLTYFPVSSVSSCQSQTCQSKFNVSKIYQVVLFFLQLTSCAHRSSSPCPLIPSRCKSQQALYCRGAFAHFIRA